MPIRNQYKLENEETIWGEWTPSQRLHFLNDHKSKLDLVITPMELLALQNQNDFEKLPHDIQEAVSEHVMNGQYKKGGDIDDYTKRLGLVKVKFQNPKYNYSTNVSAETTESDARKYFVGQRFNVGVYPRENMQKVVDVEFFPKGTYDETYAKGGSVNSHLDELVTKRKSIDLAMQDYAGELGIYNLYYGHRVDATKKAKWRRAYKYLHDKYGRKYAQGGGIHYMDKLSKSEQSEYDSLMDKFLSGKLEKEYKSYTKNINRIQELQNKQGLTRGYARGGELLNSSDDINWLLETHLKGIDNLPPFSSFRMFGNEDSPEKIELFGEAEPLYSDEPNTTLILIEKDGHYEKMAKGGFIESLATFLNKKISLEDFFE